MADDIYTLRYSANKDVEFILPDHNIIVNHPLSDERKIDVLVWNIFKQKRSAWTSVLEKYGKPSQLVLLQEAQTTPELINYVTRNHIVADQVPAFSFNDNYAGVMTLAKTYPVCALPFKEREPLIRIPKSALITIYPLAQTHQMLMVANIHAVNFSFGIKIYQQQIRLLLNRIYQHQGPVILAGDFNTWSKQRLDLLHYLTTSINLQQVRFTSDIRKTFLGRPLDFVFYRGLDIEQARTIYTMASDHNPLSVTFTY
ncbi:endonuclease/exonuclease/phosphatase family protein [Zophobihabitans entericus]|uniref:Endonuclease/exonuclease/phosphatase family protein n=1 Tax=Zophobihabitans entericus TaxID=1635327 RepID=A0A6G9IDM5_9GAMM|nr:endonuclease/exonuclease/phosphatase family protein [Zophobihabitans entericus]QIQ21804.1 endonuclease/exonuclease/phosphatase family protein [Zophobihabitans entericus]